MCPSTLNWIIGSDECEHLSVGITSSLFFRVSNRGTNVLYFSSYFELLLLFQGVGRGRRSYLLLTSFIFSPLTTHPFRDGVGVTIHYQVVGIRLIYIYLDGLRCLAGCNLYGETQDIFLPAPYCYFRGVEKRPS